MPLECINPDDLPNPEMYTQVVVATGSKLVFVSGQQPEDINGKSLATVILRLRRAWRLAISAVRLLLPVPGLSKSARSQSMSSITNATNTCRSSKRPRYAFRRSQTSKRSGRDSDDVPWLPDRGRCDRGHRPRHRKLREDAVDKSLTLNEAHEHLGKLISEMTTDAEYDKSRSTWGLGSTRRPWAAAPTTSMGRTVMTTSRAAPGTTASRAIAATTKCENFAMYLGGRIFAVGFVLLFAFALLVLLDIGT